MNLDGGEELMVMLCVLIICITIGSCVGSWLRHKETMRHLERNRDKESG